MYADVIERYTYEDYKEWEGDWELIDGVAYVIPAPMITHQGLATELLFALREQVEECEECDVLGEVDYKISDDTVVRPDVVLTCGEKNEAFLTKAPQIIVEIVSKSSAKRDEKHKFKLYESEKVPYYILVYPTDLKAKIFKLDGKFYDKVGDFLSQKYKFEDLECDVELDFERIFRRYRKRANSLSA